MARPTLILGGARSGKSRFAEELASGRAPVVYLATAVLDPRDAELAERVRKHRARRPAAWRTVESPWLLPEAVSDFGRAGGVLLVDCITIWLSNLMLGGAADAGAPALDDAAIEQRVRALADAGQACTADVIWVSSEVGGGLVPENPLGRRFRDVAGEAHQILARGAERVYWCVAGLPLGLKPIHDGVAGSPR